MNELNAIFHKASEEMYKNTSSTQSSYTSTSSNSTKNNDTEVTDADFEEVK